MKGMGKWCHAMDGDSCRNCGEPRSISWCDRSESQNPSEILWWEVFHGVDGAIPCNIAQEFLGLGIVSSRCGVLLPTLCSRIAAMVYIRAQILGETMDGTKRTTNCQWVWIIRPHFRSPSLCLRRRIDHPPYELYWLSIRPTVDSLWLQLLIFLVSDISISMYSLVYCVL